MHIGEWGVGGSTSSLIIVLEIYYNYSSYLIYGCTSEEFCSIFKLRVMSFQVIPLLGVGQTVGVGGGEGDPLLYTTREIFTKAFQCILTVYLITFPELWEGWRGRGAIGAPPYNLPLIILSMCCNVNVNACVTAIYLLANINRDMLKFSLKTCSTCLT